MRYFLFLLVLICISCNDSVVSDADHIFGDDIMTFDNDTMTFDNDTMTFDNDTMTTSDIKSTKILIDASHGGGTWWFPQGVECDPTLNHQGLAFADELSLRGFSVYETCREESVVAEQYEDLALLVIAGGYRPFSIDEAENVMTYLAAGGNVLLLMDHSAPITNGFTWSALGLNFYKTNINDVVVNFEAHKICAGMPPYLATRGVSAISGDGNGIEVIARLSPDTFLDLNYNGTFDGADQVNPIFMGALDFGKGKLVFCGDVNMWQRDMTLLNNTMSWFGLD